MWWNQQFYSDVEILALHAKVSGRKSSKREQNFLLWFWLPLTCCTRLSPILFLCWKIAVFSERARLWRRLCWTGGPMCRERSGFQLWAVVKQSVHVTVFISNPSCLTLLPEKKGISGKDSQTQYLLAEILVKGESDWFLWGRWRFVSNSSVFGHATDPPHMRSV